MNYKKIFSWCWHQEIIPLWFCFWLRKKVERQEIKKWIKEKSERMDYINF